MVSAAAVDYTFFRAVEDISGPHSPMQRKPFECTSMMPIFHDVADDR